MNINKYPYTDFHELNLDWFLAQFKTLVEEWQQTETQWNTMRESFTTLEGVVDQFTTFVTNYFDNLDVQQEINNKLNAMAEDGSLSQLLAPLVAQDIDDVVADQIGSTVASQIGQTVADQIDNVVADQLPGAVGQQAAATTTEWLNDNVDPVGSAVTVDSSLTISGSAADSKIVGDNFDQVRNGGYVTQNPAFTEGGYIENTPPGAMVSNASWKYTDFIDITNSFGRKIYAITLDANNQRVTNGLQYNGWYDKDFNYVSNLTLSATADEFDVPVNAKYVRFSCRNVEHLIFKTITTGLKQCEIKDYFKVLTWNVGMFNNGISRPSTADAPAKITELNRVIGKIDADVFNSNEFYSYVDAAETIPTVDLLSFKYGNKARYSNNSGFSKYPIISSEAITFTSESGAHAMKYYIDFNGKIICIIDAHLSIENPPTVRTQDIAQLITIMSTEKYVILTGDFNVTAQSEFTPFKTAGYKLCNGGDFGWFDTWPVFDNMPDGWTTNWPCYNLDNIIVSPTIIPQYAEMITSSMSDHAPLMAVLKIS